MAKIFDLYNVLGMKTKNSIFKSYAIKTFEGDSHANVRIEVEPYDDTFINAVERHGSDYIFNQLEKKLIKPKNVEKIKKALGIQTFEGALVTFYSDRVLEMYFKADGKNQYGVKW